MLVTGLDDKQYKLNLSRYYSKRENVSSGHKRARSLLSEIFPMETVCEEVTLPGLSQTLYVDFFIPSLKIMVEVQGQQHFAFNNFFYKNRHEFYRAKARDNLKREWCELNCIQLITLDDRENDERWREQITGNDIQGKTETI